MRVRGEISGFKGAHSSGHSYFSLKDDKARIEAVVWRLTLPKLRFRPQEGVEVIATGKLTTFPGQSKYQLVVDAMEPAGVGALMALLDARRKALTAEGLFAEARKKPLPYLPRVIGVVTLADRRCHPRHHASSARPVPDARHRVAGAGAGRNVGGGSRRGDRRLQFFSRRRALSAARRHHRGARRRQPSRTCGHSTRRSWCAPRRPPPSR